LGKTGQIATSIAKRKSDLIQIETFGRGQCDITVLQDVLKTIEAFKPDLVVNAAAYTAVDKAENEIEQAYLVNRNGAANVARITGQMGISLIHFSTDYVFSGNKTSAYIETDKIDPTGVYGLSKMAGEEAVIGLNPKHIILRTAWVYSVYGNNFLKTMLRLAAEHDELSIVGDQFGNPSDSEDMAQAVIAIANHLSNNPSFENFGVFHICGPDRMSWAGFARKIFEVSKSLDGNSAAVRKITTAEYPTAATRPANSSLNCSKFLSTFNYQNIPFENSVQNTVAALLTSIDH